MWKSISLKRFSRVFFKKTCKCPIEFRSGYRGVGRGKIAVHCLSESMNGKDVDEIMRRILKMILHYRLQISIYHIYEPSSDCPNVKRSEKFHYILFVARAVYDIASSSVFQYFFDKISYKSALSDLFISI